MGFNAGFHTHGQREPHAPLSLAARHWTSKTLPSKKTLIPVFLYLHVLRFCGDVVHVTIPLNLLFKITEALYHS